MRSLVDKFAELEALLVDDRQTLALHAGVPFVLLIYHPKEEHRCRQEQARLAERLGDSGIIVREISLESFVLDHYADIGLLEKLLQKEILHRQSVYRDLAKNSRPALCRHIIRVSEELDSEDAILFVCGLAHLFPFVRVSNLLEDLENRVKLPLVMFYPGEELDGELRFLCLENADGPHSKYRARRI